jgi:hypothetical protein
VLAALARATSTRRTRARAYGRQLLSVKPLALSTAKALLWATLDAPPAHVGVGMPFRAYVAGAPRVRTQPAGVIRGDSDALVRGRPALPRAPCGNHGGCGAEAAAVAAYGVRRGAVHARVAAGHPARARRSDARDTAEQ